MEDEPLGPDQQIEVVCQLAQEAFNNKTTELEGQLADVQQAISEQNSILAQQSHRREVLTKQVTELRRALQDLHTQNDEAERDVEDLGEQRARLVEFKKTLMKTVNAEEGRSVASSEERTPAWESYLTERRPDASHPSRDASIFSVTRDLKSQLPYDDYRKLTQELRRLTKGEQSKAETIAKLRVLLRGRESSFEVLQSVLEGS